MLRQSPTAALRAIVRPVKAAGGYGKVPEGYGGQKRSAHAISNPTLANIEKRWEGLPPQEQADLWMALRDRMKVNWAELTLEEKKAAYYIAFGAHGPTAHAPPNPPTKDGRYSVTRALVSEPTTLLEAGASGLAAILYVLALAVLYKFTNKWTPLMLLACGAIMGQFLFV